MSDANIVIQFTVPGVPVSQPRQRHRICMNTQTIAKRLAGRINHARKASQSKRYNTALRAQERIRVLSEVIEMINSYRKIKGLQ